MESTPSTAAWVVLAALIVALWPWQPARPERSHDPGDSSAARWCMVPATVVTLIPIVFAARRGDWQAAGWWALAAPAAVSVLARVFGAPILIAWRHPKDLADAGFRVGSLLVSPVVTFAVMALVARAAGADDPLAAALSFLMGYFAWELVRRRASEDRGAAPDHVRV